MPRETHYAESLDGSSRDTGYGEKVSLSFTPQPNSLYLLLATWSHAGTTAADTLARFRSGDQIFNESIRRAKDASDWFPAASLSVEEFGESPAQRTYVIEWASGSGSDSASIRDARITALQLASEDQYVLDLTRETNDTLSFADKATLVFTPASQGDYYVIAVGTQDTGGTSQARTRLLIDGVDTGLLDQQRQASASERFS